MSDISWKMAFTWVLYNLFTGIQAQKILDENEGLLPGQQLINEGVFGSWLVRYSNILLNSNLTLSAALQGDLDGNSLLALVGANYTINDNWAVDTQIISINSNTQSPLIFFVLSRRYDDDNAYLACVSA